MKQSYSPLGCYVVVKPTFNIKKEGGAISFQTDRPCTISRQKLALVHATFSLKFDYGLNLLPTLVYNVHQAAYNLHVKCHTLRQSCK